MKADDHLELGTWDRYFHRFLEQSTPVTESDPGLQAWVSRCASLADQALAEYRARYPDYDKPHTG